MVPSFIQQYRYAVDREDRLTFVDTAWKAFAKDNQAEELTQPSMVGQPVWDFIAGTEVKHLYRMVFDSVRKHKRAVSFPFRCDSPISWRYMELSIEPDDDGGLCLSAGLRREEARPHLALFDESTAEPESFVKICSWCKRIPLTDGRWVEVEDAIRALDLFRTETPPGLTHGMCPDCASSVEQAMRLARND